MPEVKLPEHPSGNENLARVGKSKVVGVGGGPRLLNSAEF